MQVAGYIDQNRENGKYRLGMKLVERGNLVVNSIDIREKARSYLLDLASQTGQTTHLAILDGKEGCISIKSKETGRDYLFAHWPAFTRSRHGDW